MDPNANLDEQRRILAKVLYALHDYEHERLADLERLAELVRALDEWITKGGFLPKDWTR